MSAWRRKENSDKLYTLITNHCPFNKSLYVARVMCEHSKRTVSVHVLPAYFQLMACSLSPVNLNNRISVLRVINIGRQSFDERCFFPLKQKSAFLVLLRVTKEVYYPFGDHGKYLSLIKRTYMCLVSDQGFTLSTWLGPSSTRTTSLSLTTHHFSSTILSVGRRKKTLHEPGCCVPRHAYLGWVISQFPRISILPRMANLSPSAGWYVLKAVTTTCVLVYFLILKLPPFSNDQGMSFSFFSYSQWFSPFSENKSRIDYSTDI